jgi:hypothetical protein
MGPFLPLLPVGKMRLLNIALFAPENAIIGPQIQSIRQNSKWGHGNLWISMN